MTLKLIDLIKAQVPTGKNYLQLMRNQLQQVEGKLTKYGGFIEIIPTIEKHELIRISIKISGTSIWIAQIEKEHIKLFENFILPTSKAWVCSLQTDFEFEVCLKRLAEFLAKIIIKEQLT